MRRLFAFLVFVAIVIVAVGFWRGWWTLLVNKPQIQQDTRELRHEAKQGAEKVKEGVHQGAEKVEQKTNN